MTARDADSTRILGLDPTTFEAYGVHPIVDSTKFGEGVGDAHIRLWTRLNIGRECHV